MSICFIFIFIYLPNLQKRWKKCIVRRIRKLEVVSANLVHFIEIKRKPLLIRLFIDYNTNLLYRYLDQMNFSWIVSNFVCLEYFIAVIDFVMFSVDFCIKIEFQLGVFVIENPGMCQHNYFYRFKLCSALIIQIFVNRLCLFRLVFFLKIALHNN